ncbi:MAG: 2-amino-4-hydroxy-6-hydroxymethyldihydropteridine diphosphokinase [Chryseotalea sp. WA131a]|jgi:2-amino-4-hydroxy-6-hydroxymethyldihydropteridine diphosphokinase|nr:MAG: 2-amino-4-hydroxy-6-hydroxymethyldihydropteridine diphosphokinase [Chryseotalea sp. WA131a]
MEEQVFLLLGTNDGNRMANLNSAKDEIKKSVGLVVEESAIYQTAAWGKTDQPDFYNQVLLLQTTMSPEALLLHLQQIEKKLGRERKEKWGARIIDIDILYFGKTVLNTPDLLIPHPAIALRRFTLVPLVEIAPHFVHPVLKKTNLVLLQECVDVLAVKRVD